MVSHIRARKNGVKNNIEGTAAVGWKRRPILTSFIRHHET